MTDSNQPDMGEPVIASTSTLCRSRRSTRGTRTSICFVDEVYCSSSTCRIDPCSTTSSLAYTTELHTDLDTGEVHCEDPRAHAAKFKIYNDDNPSFTMAMYSSDADKWKEAMVKEIQGLLKYNT